MSQTSATGRPTLPKLATGIEGFDNFSLGGQPSGRTTLVPGGALFLLDARMSPDVVQAGDFDLSGLLAMLQAKQREIGAQWIAFDGIDVLLDRPSCTVP